MKSIPFVMLAAALASATAASAIAADATGLWSTRDARAQVRISPCGGDLCGTIVRLAEPNDPATGQPKTDKNNSDPARRTRPLVGSQVLINMRPNGSAKWTGQIYDAENGRTVSGSITLTGGNALKLEGCALGGMVCRSQTWMRIK